MIFIELAQLRTAILWLFLRLMVEVWRDPEAFVNEGAGARRQ